MRTQIEGRPLLLVALALVAGIVLARYPLAGFLLGIGLVFWMRPLNLRALASVGILVGFARMVPLLPGPSLAVGPFVGEVHVASVPSATPRGGACLAETALGRVQLFWNGHADVSLGDRLHVIGRAKPPQEGMERWAEAAGMVGVVTCHQEGIQRRQDGPLLFRWAKNWRDGFLNLCQTAMAPKAAKLTGALCLNADQALSPEERDHLMRSGTTHIVSASGLHVFVLALAVQGVLGMLPLRRGAQVGILVLVLAYYALAAGLEAPIVRSVVMAGLLSAAYLVRREGDLLGALSAAGVGWLAFEPRAVFDIGFQLSFVTVAGLGLFHFATDTPTSLISAVKEGLKDAFGSSAVASLVSAPLVAYHFGSVSLISVLANVLIAAILAPILVVALFAYAISGVAMPVSVGLLKGLVEPWTGWVWGVVDGLGGLPFAAVMAPEIPVWGVLISYGLVAAVWRWKPRAA